MEGYIASKKALNKAKVIFHKMQKYSSRSCDRIEKYRGKEYEVGQIVIPILTEDNSNPVYRHRLNAKLLNAFSTSIYDDDFFNDSVFIISEKRFKPEYIWKVVDKVSGATEKWLVRVPIYDLVKLDDPSKELYGIKCKYFKVCN